MTPTSDSKLAVLVLRRTPAGVLLVQLETRACYLAITLIES